MPKRPIPQPPAVEESLLRVLRALKENLEEIMGLRNGKIEDMTDDEERWQDLLSDIGAGRAIGANAPSWATFRGGVSAYSFSASAMNEVWFTAHIPHDYKPDTAIFPHVHWSTTGTNAGVVRWGFEYTIAKGHTQEAFPATTTVYVEQAFNGTAYTHMIAEPTDAAAISSASLQPDTLIMCRLFRDAAHINDTQTGAAFAFFADFHYQSDENLTTKRFPILGQWFKNLDGHASNTMSKINEIIRKMQ